MAVPQRKPRYQRPVRGWTKGRSATGGASGRTAGQGWRGGIRLGRALGVLVVPVLLMLGSVYVHTVAAELGGEAARLKEEKARAEGEGERLDVRLTELSEPVRIRTLARENLGMRDPGKDLTIYGSDGEDVANGGGEKKKETGQ